MSDWKQGSCIIIMKNLNEYINESLFGAGLGVAALAGSVIYATLALINFAFKDVYPNGVAPYPHEVIKDWYENKKIAKIFDRLKDDEDIIAFFSQPKYKQQHGWNELIKSKLSNDELKYIAKITKTKFE